MIKTDYSCIKDLFLVYPKGFNGANEELCSFFKKLISIIPENINCYIIVNNENAENEINQLYGNTNKKIILIEGFHEIWLRDIFGFNTGNKRIYRPIFEPDYCNYLYPKNYLDLIENQVHEIFKKTIDAEVIEMPLKLDGGNFITNGKIGFVTDKVLKQNPEISNYIKKIIFDYLGVSTVIVKSNKNDKLAHIDGYISFLNESTICVPNYPNIPFLKEDNLYLQYLKSTVSPYAENVIEILDRPVDEKVSGGGQTEKDKSNECLSSARGIYSNYLILNNTIILPEYNLPNYKKTIDHNSMNRRTFELLGYEVKSINCDELSKMGGSLHCISFTN